MQPDLVFGENIVLVPWRSNDPQAVHELAILTSHNGRAAEQVIAFLEKINLEHLGVR
jgi:hypothetical protein